MGIDVGGAVRLQFIRRQHGILAAGISDLEWNFCALFVSIPKENQQKNPGFLLR